jgi:hypothetical protein
MRLYIKEYPFFYVVSGGEFALFLQQTLRKLPVPLSLLLYSS